MEKKKKMLLYRIGVALIAGTGLMIYLGIFKGQWKPNIFVYYTVQSNFVCFLYFLFASLKGVVHYKNGEQRMTPLPRLKGAVTMCITVTFLIYLFLLAPLGTVDVFWKLDNLLVHVLVPIIVIVDWLLWGPWGSYKRLDPFLWVSIPYAYFAFAIIRAETIGGLVTETSRFPYPFIDYDVLGIGRVAINVIVLTILFIALGYIFYFVDRRLGKRR